MSYNVESAKSVLIFFKFAICYDMLKISCLTLT